MKLIKSQRALWAVLLTMAFTAPGHAQDAAKPTVSQQQLQAKIRFCETCHGLNAQGFRGSSPMPRLAGQTPQYIENQLQAFADRARENKFMYGVSHALTPAMRAGLVKYFSELNPKPLDTTAPSELAAAGKKIYESGVPDENVPPCAGCHGPAAEGNGEFPRLAGQLHDYTFNKLANWSKEWHPNRATPDASVIMAPIAHSLTKPQIEAVAAYLSRLE
jgi:cytochrome c553